MINADRIVPIQATDLITNFSVMLAIANVSVTKLAAAGIGEFTVPENGTYLAAEPVKALDFDDATAATVYFVADYDYEGVKIDGAATTPTGSVDANGSTLYKAVLATNAVTITKVGF